jgi:hypothetical protein
MRNYPNSKERRKKILAGEKCPAWTYCYPTSTKHLPLDNV